VSESGKPLPDAEGVRSVADSPEGVKLLVGSGTYRFSFPAPAALR